MSVEADDTLKLCAAYPRLLLKSNTNRGPPPTWVTLENPQTIEVAMIISDDLS